MTNDYKRYYSEIPDYMRGGITNYVEYGRETGSFLMAIFENDFVLAVMSADPTNERYLMQYAWILNTMPVNSWGSREAVDKWMKSGGLNGGAVGSDGVAA